MHRIIAAALLTASAYGHAAAQDYPPPPTAPVRAGEGSMGSVPSGLGRDTAATRVHGREVSDHPIVIIPYAQAFPSAMQGFPSGLGR